MPSEPRYVTLPELFAGSLFRVPDYQRGYAWTERQLDDLWSDLALLDDRTQHFTGMVVVEPHADSPRHHAREMRSYRVLQVIDGQQRLTSIVLLMGAIVGHMEAHGDALAKEQAAGLRRQYLGESGWRRLGLNDDSHAFFEHILATGEPPGVAENGSQANLRDAHAYFTARISDVPAARTLAMRLQSNLRFVYYEVDDDAEAGLIFEVMNNRGKPLSQADRLKNYQMYLAHKVGMSGEAVRAVARRWGQVFKHVMQASPDGSGRDSEDRLLANHWILYKEAQAPKSLRGLSFSQRVRHDMLLTPAATADERASRDARLQASIEAYTTSLVTSASDFSELFNPAGPHALGWVRDDALRDRIRRGLLSFHRMGHFSTVVPLLMAGRRRLGAHPEAFEALVDLLSRYSFRVYAICNRRSYAGQPHFRRQARRLFTAPEAELEAHLHALLDDIRGWIGWYGNDQQMAEMLRDRHFYDSHSAREIRYLFYEYEEHLCGGQVPSMDWSTFANSRKTQVEHIFPKKGPALLEDSREKHDKNVNRLGNLTVSHFNQKLGTKAFADKKRTYRKSSLLIESSLARKRTWGLAAIKKREDELVRFVMQRWAV
jgi:hypothetical protein